MIRHRGRGEHGVERRSKFSVPVPYQELEALGPVVEVHQQVPGLLGYPLPRRMSGDPDQVHSAGAVLNEKHQISQ
jgi:hypothetical protein